MSPKDLSPAEVQRIYETKGWMLNHLHQPFTTKKLAQRAAMNERKFREAFHYLFEITIGEYVHEARMQTGIILIRLTGNPIKMIAAQTGYRYTKNFMIAFKRRFGRTPREVRRMRDER